MSAHKRLFISSALACLVVAAFATTSDAQVFRGRGRVSRVVVVGGFYSPFWIDPWYALDYQWGLYPPYYPYYRRRYGRPSAQARTAVGSSLSSAAWWASSARSASSARAPAG